MHRTSARFWICFDKLPDPIQKFSNRILSLLKTNPSHPSLHFKKVGKFWSFRIGMNSKALAIKQEEDFIWIWIGTHDDYERLIKEGK